MWETLILAALAKMEPELKACARTYIYIFWVGLGLFWKALPMRCCVGVRQLRSGALGLGSVGCELLCPRSGLDVYPP